MLECPALEPDSTEELEVNRPNLQPFNPERPNMTPTNLLLAGILLALVAVVYFLHRVASYLVVG